MKKLSFPYKKEPSTLFGYIYRPVVEIFLKTKENQWFQVSTYADTGADITIFPGSICQILSLPLHEGEESMVKGVGGEEIKSLRPQNHSENRQRRTQDKSWLRRKRRHTIPLRQNRHPNPLQHALRKG